MTIPFTALTWLIAAFCVLAVLSVFTAVFAFVRKKRAVFWGCFLAAIVTALSSFAAFRRLESIHSELLQGGPQIKEKADLLSRYGRPSSTKTYLNGKQEIECWIYEVTWLKPTISTQFEMIDGKVCARISANNI
jgi:hypothetical protein